MWATLETWLLGDGEVDELGIDDVLRHKGLRLSCKAFAPSAGADSGALAIGAAADGDVTYRLRGRVVAAWRQAAVLDIGACLVLLEPDAVRTVQGMDGHDALERFSADFKTPTVGATGEAVGRLEVVPDYEWEALHQFDARRDWRLTGVFLVERQAVPSVIDDDVVSFSGDPVHVRRMERLDTTADSGPGNAYLVNLEPAPGSNPSTVPASQTAEDYAIQGVVREWYPEQGWGVVDSSQTPGGCWVHFSTSSPPGTENSSPAGPSSLSSSQRTRTASPTAPSPLSPSRKARICR